MKVAPLITVALILCIAFLGPIQAKKKPKPKFCIGKNGVEYAVGDGYIDTEGEDCIRYRCFKKKKKVFMKENKCIDGEWSDWSSWSGCMATCGNATRTKERTCSNPPPSKGGNQCSGPDEKIEECSLPKCRPDMNVRVDSLELNFQSLNDSVQTVQTTMLSVLELMTTMQAAANKQGTCLSDLSSSECPASAAGKVGVVDGIAANTANITTNTAGLAESKAGVATNQAGVATNQAGVATNQAGVATNQAGVATNKAGVATNKAGVATNQAGVATNKAGVVTNKAGVATNKAGVATNQAGVTTNQAGVATNKAGVATNKAGVAINQVEVATNKEDITFNNDTCSSIQATATKLETCLSDVNSVDCPSSKGGKTSVPDAIIKNKDAVQTHHPDTTPTITPTSTTATTATSSTTTAGLLHTDANYEYYKVPVPASSKMTSAVVLTTCIKLGMKPQCHYSGNADSNCVQAPSTSIHREHPKGMSKILCGTTRPQDCASTLNMFWYIINWQSGSACGATKAGFCSAGISYTSTSDMQYFAACLKPVTTDPIAVLLHTDANYEYYKVPVLASSKMTSAVVLTTCIKLGMTPQCFRAYYADSNCVQAPSTSFHSYHPIGMSKILCSTDRPQDCASTLNMFWYINPDKNWHSGSACGATKGGFCVYGKDYTSTSDMQYFAACLKPVTTG